MKKNKNQVQRIEELIRSDRLNMKEDFTGLLCNDIDNVLKDYFDYKGLPIVTIDKNGGSFLVRISVNANAIHSFYFIPEQDVKY